MTVYKDCPVLIGFCREGTFSHLVDMSLKSEMSIAVLERADPEVPTLVHPLAGSIAIAAFIDSCAQLTAFRGLTVQHRQRALYV